jgi:amidase
MSEPILTVDQLRSGYGRIPVLQGVTFQVNAGEVVGLLGHNGMGKTTLLKTLMGYIPATGGVVSYDGMDITRRAAHERANLGIAYVPQGRGMFAGLTARENLEFAWNGANGHDVDTAIEGILHDLPRLQVLLDRQAGALSGGEQQILAIARGLISEPDLLLLDEPTEGIQPSIIDEIALMLSRLQKDRGLAMVVVEQNLDFLIALSDRMLLLEKGAITGDLRGDQMRDAALLEDKLRPRRNQSTEQLRILQHPPQQIICSATSLVPISPVPRLLVPAWRQVDNSLQARIMNSATPHRARYLNRGHI